MAPRHGYIVDTQIALVATAQFENGLALRRTNYVDDSRVILLLGETFEDHVVALRLIILDQVVCFHEAAICGTTLGLHLQWVRRLADLALERFPEERLEVVLDFGLLARLQPARQAAVVNLTDRSSALARAEKGVLPGGFGGPTETALALGVLVAHVGHRRRHLDKLFKIFLVRVRENGVSAMALLFLGWLIDLHLVGFADFFDRKLDSANFQDVLLLNFVILRRKISQISLLKFNRNKTFQISPKLSENGRKNNLINE